MVMKSKLFWRILLVIWCGLIFFMSSNNSDESSNQSMFIAMLLNRWIGQVLGPHAFMVTETAVRKAAHLFEYLVLGSLLFMGFLDRTRIRRTILIVFLAGIFLAVSDELHQCFVPGRTMRVTDLAIDALGGFAGCVTAYFPAVRRQKKLRVPIIRDNG